MKIFLTRKPPGIDRNFGFNSDFRISSGNPSEKKILDFQLQMAIEIRPVRDKTTDGPLPLHFFQFIKIYPVLDPCKSWGHDITPRYARARGTMSTNEYLPYPTYIHLGGPWQHAGSNKQISCRSTSATYTTVHIISHLIVNVLPKNIHITLL